MTCISIGCGKPSWNGADGEVCSPKCRETFRIAAATENGDEPPLLQSTVMPDTDTFFGNVEKRVANDGKAYTYAEFEDPVSYTHLTLPTILRV